jgi:hypothetical protein
MPKLPPRPEVPRREADVMGEVRTMLSSMAGVVHWRNNVGSLQDARGRFISYGLCEGSADLIACVQTALTCPSCGVTLPPIGRFVGIEVKGPSTRTTEDQFAWARVVTSAHGVAGFAHADLDAKALVYQARTQW